MNEDVQASRLRVSRRRLLSLGGSLSMGALLAACSGDDSPAPDSSTATPATTGSPGGTAISLLDRTGTCVMAEEETQGPYWFDVDSIRTDLREDRPGTRFTLAMRVQDVSACSSGGEAKPVPNCVVEIWHCDAGGVYSGFESSSTGPAGGAPSSGPSGTGGPGAPGGPGGAPPSGGMGGSPPAGSPNPSGGEGPGSGAGASGETSDGSYSVGDTEAQTGDDGTYLRGAQIAGADGVVQFTTLYPGWYRGRTMHVHVKVHVDRKTVLTTQVFVDDALTDKIYLASPYDDHTGRDTTNATDSIFDESGLLTVVPDGDGYLGVINLGIDA